MIHDQSIAVIDFGSQYTQLIARRIRDLNVFSEIFPFSISLDELKSKQVKAIILSGGPSSVYEENAPKISEDILNSGIPILGICYGLQLLMQHSGGNVHSTGKGEYGFAQILSDSSNVLFKDFPLESQVWMSHGDEVENLPDGWAVLSKSTNDIVAAVQKLNHSIYGVQFHPEVIHSIHGKELLSNFLFDISGCEPNWTPANFVADAIQSIKDKVGDKKVICGLSGGVDSSVVATLLHRAIGEQSQCVFIDHGLLRKNEAEQVMTTLKDGLGLSIHKFEHSKKFLSKLEGIKDPESKRKIIGKQFIRSFEEATSILGESQFLAQGTLYPDVIESGGSALGPAVTIKSHHNVGGLPDDIEFELIEPLRELFKDEVRKVGEELGLPHFAVNRHPFPGPGLAVRILGEITPERIEILQNADDIFIEILHERGEYDKIWQAFAVLIPTKTVGVMGDARTYENLLGLRAVTSMDGMTADWYNMPYDVLNECSSRIVNEVKGVNRVVYDITAKPPGTIEWE